MVDLRGRIAAIITPFTDDGSGLSEIRLARLVRRLVAQGVGGFAICTETGEFTCLSFSERKQVLEIVVRESQSAVPVVSNVSTLSTSSSLDLAQHAQRHGAKGVILMPPYYGSFTSSEIAWHFKTVVQYSDAHIVAVDPLKMIDEDVESALEETRGISIAQRPCRSDSCVVNTAEISAVWGLPVDLSRNQAERLGELIKRHGGAKVIKAALDELNIEMGIPRKPLQVLDRPIQQEIAAIVAESH